MKFGTEEQKQKYLPRMATGEIRAAFSLSEPELGSDVAGDQDERQEAATTARYEINGQKMWVTNGLRSASSSCSSRPTPRPTRATAASPASSPRRRPGVAREHRRVRRPQRPAADQEARLQGRRVDRARLRRLPLPGREHPRRRGGRPEPGFAQMMDALEVGRVNVAARGVGIAQRALELALQVLRRSAAPSASRSPSTRRSSSSSPTWRRRSRPPAC